MSISEEIFYNFIFDFLMIKYDEKLYNKNNSKKTHVNNLFNTNDNELYDYYLYNEKACSIKVLKKIFTPNSFICYNIDLDDINKLSQNVQKFIIWHIYPNKFIGYKYDKAYDYIETMQNCMDIMNFLNHMWDCGPVLHESIDKNILCDIRQDVLTEFVKVQALTQPDIDCSIDIDAEKAIIELDRQSNKIKECYEEVCKTYY